MDFLKTLAPTVATALLGPLGGVAISALGTLLGIDGATQAKIADAIQSGQMTPEQVTAIKKMELDYQTHEADLGFSYAELVFKDADSARNREIQVKDNTNKVLAYLIIVSFLAMVAATMMGWTKAESVMAGTMIGYLSAKAEQILSYYFGSNKDSARKTELIASAPAK